MLLLCLSIICRAMDDHGSEHGSHLSLPDSSVLTEQTEYHAEATATHHQKPVPAWFPTTLFSATIWICIFVVIWVVLYRILRRARGDDTNKFNPPHIPPPNP
jgi:hypothetical protein